MEKLILTYCWGSEPCSGENQICFEYESKDKFIFDLLEKFKDYPFREAKGSWFSYADEVEIFKDGPCLTKSDIENIENNLYTLEEWFDQEKIGFTL